MLTGMDTSKTASHIMNHGLSKSKQKVQETKNDETNQTSKTWRKRTSRFVQRLWSCSHFSIREENVERFFHFFTSSDFSNSKVWLKCFIATIFCLFALKKLKITTINTTQLLFLLVLDRLQQSIHIVQLFGINLDGSRTASHLDPYVFLNRSAGRPAPICHGHSSAGSANQTNFLWKHTVCLICLFWNVFVLRSVCALSPACHRTNPSAQELHVETLKKRCFRC